MSGNSAFVMVSERGWRRGFSNLLNNELARWWKTRMWWIQCLIWAAATVMLVADVMLNKRLVTIRYAVESYASAIAIFQAVGVVVLMQGALVGEKKDGTAAWVLSKPAARPAFILSKVVANSLGVLVTMVGVSALVFHILALVAKRVPPDPVHFLAALGLVLLHHLFFMSLMLMLGALFSGRGPVLGIPAAVLVFEWDLLRKWAALRYVLPLAFFMEPGGRTSAFVSLLAGRSIHSYVPMMVAVAAECLLFLGIAVWRFSREEL
jgi:hypothetical protein